MNLEELLAPIRDTAASISVSAARLVKNVGTRLDAMSLDLARDGGAVVRTAKDLAFGARDRAFMVKAATPRVSRIAQAATALFARQRWLRLAQAARTGDPKLREEDHRDLARRTTAYAAELRGGIAKIGQLASCRPDLVGPVWASELAKLQDEVPPVDAGAIRQSIESELGKPIAEMFAEFDDVPIAAASLAQVHAAKLLDGSEVVVKVQVPGIDDVITADIAALRAIASAVGEVPGIDLLTLTTELARALATELDYEAEADALWAYSGGALVPRPVPQASSRRVLTMTRITGERLTTWLEHADRADRDRLLGDLVSEVAAQILARGQVQADPHPGNFLVTSATPVPGAPEVSSVPASGDGKLALLDFGCMLELSAAERASYARLVIAIAGSNHAGAAHELESLGFRADDPDQLVDLAASLVGALRPGANAAQLDWQAAFADQIAQARQLGGLVIPRSFVLLGRVLASLGGLLATYKPRLELHPLIARHLAAAIASK